MNYGDALKRMRIRDGMKSDELTRLRQVSQSGLPSVIARTKTLVSYPTVASRFYACEAISVMGQEVEGAVGSVSANSGSFFAYNLGAAVPPSGATIIATFAGSRWVFRYDG